MTNVQWIVKLLQEAGLTTEETTNFLTIIYEGLTLNQDLESKVAYINTKYIDVYSLVPEEIYGLTNQDIIELKEYIT